MRGGRNDQQGEDEFGVVASKAPGIYIIMLAVRRTVQLRAPLLSRVAARSYHETIVDHYESPRNVGSFDKNDPEVGTGLVGAPACGDVMKLQMRVVDGKVEHAVFKVRPAPAPHAARPCPRAPPPSSRAHLTRIHPLRRRLGAARRSRARRTRLSG